HCGAATLARHCCQVSHLQPRKIANASSHMKPHAGSLFLNAKASSGKRANGAYKIRRSINVCPGAMRRPATARFVPCPARLVTLVFIGSGNFEKRAGDAVVRPGVLSVHANAARSAEAVSIAGEPAIGCAQDRLRTGKLIREPDRPRPPESAGDFSERIRAAQDVSVTRDQTHLIQEAFLFQTETFRDSGRLQRGEP